MSQDRISFGPLSKGNYEDPCQGSLSYPQLAPCNAPPPVLPSQWQCTALLHPFSPPYDVDPEPNSPFFQLCTANIEYKENEWFSAQITGCSYGTWWYVVSPDGTQLSIDQGITWTNVDMGWSLPSTNWLGEAIGQAACAGTSYINWMQAQQVNWWKIPVPNSNAATWYWFNSVGPSAGLPFRLMFGQPPQAQPQPIMGDPSQLALFQMYAFIYFPTFNAINVTERTKEWLPLSIDGFQCGNPEDYEMVIWTYSFGMTTFMTPVDEASNPLPTRVLYHWTSDSDYQVLTDRAQNTLMWYVYNPASANLLWEEALMFGSAPSRITPPPHSGTSFIIDEHLDNSQTCVPLTAEGAPLAAEPPDWAYEPGVNGTIQACISNNPTLCPNNIVTVISVLFPPSDEYPQGRYLWTWYSPFPGSDGTHSRPVTFMESASTIAEGGTSLALADYFDYQEFISDPNCFLIPESCSQSNTMPTE